MTKIKNGLGTFWIDLEIVMLISCYTNKQTGWCKKKNISNKDTQIKIITLI